MHIYPCLFLCLTPGAFWPAYQGHFDQGAFWLGLVLTRSPSQGWTLFRTDTHGRFYFFHNVFFSCDNFTKHQKSLSNHWQSWSEAGNHSWVWKIIHWNSSNDIDHLIQSIPLQCDVKSSAHDMELTHCGLVTLYGVTYLGQHWLR